MKKEGEKSKKMRLTKTPPTSGGYIMKSHRSNISVFVSSKFSHFTQPNIANIIPPCWLEMEKPGRHKSGD